MFEKKYIFYNNNNNNTVFADLHLMLSNLYECYTISWISKIYSWGPKKITELATTVIVKAR